MKGGWKELLKSVLSRASNVSGRVRLVSIRIPAAFKGRRTQGGGAGPCSSDPQLRVHVQQRGGGG